MVKDVDFTKKGDWKYYGIINRMHGRMLHSRRRAIERYGLEMTEYDYFKLIEQIVTHEAEYIRPARNDGFYMYRVRFKGQPMLAIYESANAMICTFLTWEMV